MIGLEGEGFKVTMSALDNGRYTVAAGATGIFRASMEAGVAYALVSAQTIPYVKKCPRMMRLYGKKSEAFVYNWVMVSRNLLLSFFLPCFLIT